MHSNFGNREAKKAPNIKNPRFPIRPINYIKLPLNCEESLNYFSFPKSTEYLLEIWYVSSL